MCIRDRGLELRNIVYDIPTACVLVTCFVAIPFVLVGTLRAVSYTHLDVYKRQVWDRVSDADALLGQADNALYRVKQHGKEGYFVFGEEDAQ